MRFVCERQGPPPASWSGGDGGGPAGLGFTPATSAPGLGRTVGYILSAVKTCYGKKGCGLHYLNFEDNYAPLHAAQRRHADATCRGVIVCRVARLLPAAKLGTYAPTAILSMPLHAWRRVRRRLPIDNRVAH